MTLIGLKNVVWLASQVVTPVIERFASLYESFQALTSVQVSHFIDWFSGDVLDTIWTTTNTTVVMKDEIDGGVRFTFNGTGDWSSVTFNNKRHYDETASIMIFITKRAAAGAMISGLSNNILISQTNSAFYDERSTVTFKRLTTLRDGSESSTNTDIANNTDFVGVKIECGSADIKLTLDGVLKVTKTTNRPNAALQPTFNTTATDDGTQVRFLEAYNTSVAILSSLSERLSALTQVMGQRVVETFSGALLNERWNKTDITGAGSTTTQDGVDAGLEIITGPLDNDESAIDFNDKRQYDNADAVCILVASAIANARFRSGFSENTDMSNSFALVDMDADNTNYELSTDDGTTESSLASDIAIDTNFHNHKIENGSADIKLTIDGVLKVTKTTNRPDIKQQPYFAVKARSTGQKSGNIIYLEAYNKLTTETDYPSVYEFFRALTTVAKQHFWDWLDGSVWNNRWVKTDIAGAGSITIQDGIDGGGLVTSGASANNETQANFNNKRQYAHDGAICIFTMKAPVISSLHSYGGFSGNQSSFDGIEKALVMISSTNTNIALRTADGSLGSEDTATGVPIDTALHSFKIECGSADIKLFIDGVLSSTKTTNRPTTKMQPCVGVKTLTASAKTTQLGFFEALNT